MLADITKFYFIFLCSIYMCLKILNYKFANIFYKIGLTIFSLCLACLAYFFNLHITELTYIGPLILLWILISFLYMRPQNAFIATTIAFGISYSSHALFSFTFTIIISLIYYDNGSPPYFMLALLSAVFQMILTIAVTHIKRFRNGMPFLFSTTIINIATIICLLLIAFLMYVHSNHTNYSTRVFAISLFIMPLAILIHWWQAQITKSYKHALQLRELESLRTELQEKDKLISELTTQNEQLGRLIHKDNKFIPAMENAVCDYLVSDFEDLHATREKGNMLLLEVRNLSNSRTNIISEIYAQKCQQYSTDIPSLNTLLNYMEKRAKQDNITLSVHIALNLNEHIPRVISTEDFVHLLSDLLENAFIATSKCPNRTVQLQFYQSQKSFVIETADNGIPFEATSLVNFGLTQLTTHADTGGSGIGLMDIWKLKEKYRASLHITEYETASPYSKKISIIFNKKNLYSVETWRKEEIEQISKRSDLLIYTYKENFK